MCETTTKLIIIYTIIAKPGDRKQESRQEHSLYRCRTGVCSFITNAEHLAGHVVIMVRNNLECVTCCYPCHTCCLHVVPLALFELVSYMMVVFIFQASFGGGGGTNSLKSHKHQGFQHHVSFLYCFLDGVLSGLSVKPLVFMTPDAQQLSDALVCLEGMDSVPLKGKEILILPGDPMKYQVGIEGEVVVWYVIYYVMLSTSFPLVWTWVCWLVAKLFCIFFLKLKKKSN